MTQKTIRMLCIDQALSVCGWAVIDLKFEKNKTVQPKLIVVRYGILKPAGEAAKVANRDMTELFTKQLFSLNLLRSYISKLIDTFSPDYIIAEDAFYNPRRPNAFASLLQCLCSIALLCMEKYQKPLYRIPTRSAKQTLFGSGAANKGDVIQAVLDREDIIFKQKKNMENIVEHEADSIALGVHFANMILPGLIGGREINDG